MKAVVVDLNPVTVRVPTETGKFTANGDPEVEQLAPEALLEQKQIENRPPTSRLAEGISHDTELGVPVTMGLFEALIVPDPQLSAALNITIPSPVENAGPFTVYEQDMELIGQVTENIFVNGTNTLNHRSHQLTSVRFVSYSSFIWNEEKDEKRHL